MKRQEQQLQIECVRWFRLQYPKELLFHIPNGGKRSKTEAAIFKAMGVVAGVPDLFLAVQCNHEDGGLFIEMKSDAGKLTDSQKEIHDKLRDYSYRVEVVNSFEQFMEVVNDYLN